MNKYEILLKNGSKLDWDGDIFLLEYSKPLLPKQDCKDNNTLYIHASDVIYIKSLKSK